MFIFRLLYPIYFSIFLFSFLFSIDILDRLQKSVSDKFSAMIAGKIRDIGDKIEGSEKQYVFNKKYINQLLPDNNKLAKIIENFIQMWLLLNESSKKQPNGKLTFENTENIINYLDSLKNPQDIIIEDKNTFYAKKDDTYALVIKNILQDKDIPEEKRVKDQIGKNIIKKIFYFYRILNDSMESYFSIEKFPFPKDTDFCDRDSGNIYFGPRLCVLLRGGYDQLYADIEKMNVFLSNFYIKKLKHKIILSEKEIEKELQDLVSNTQIKINTIIQKKIETEAELQQLKTTIENGRKKHTNMQEQKNNNLPQEPARILKQNRSELYDLERNFDTSLLEKQIKEIEEKIIALKNKKQKIKSGILKSYLGIVPKSQTEAEELKKKKRELEEEIRFIKEQKERERLLFLNQTDSKIISENNTIVSSYIQSTIQEAAVLRNVDEELLKEVSEVKKKIAQYEMEEKALTQLMISNKAKEDDIKKILLSVESRNTIEKLNNDFIENTDLIKKINYDIEIINRIYRQKELGLIEKIFIKEKNIELPWVEQCVDPNVFSVFESLFDNPEKSEFTSLYTQLSRSVLEIKECYKKISSYLSFFLVFQTYASGTEKYLSRLFTFSFQANNQVNPEDDTKNQKPPNIQGMPVLNRNQRGYLQKILLLIKLNFLKMKDYISKKRQ